jgi:hypothetical protein
MNSPTIFFLAVNTVKRWSRLKAFQEIDPKLFKTGGEERNDLGVTLGKIAPLNLGRFIMSSNYKQAGVLHFLSHRWSSARHPDPEGNKIAMIADEFPDDALVWLDYCCLPQEPRDRVEQQQFIQGLNVIPNLISRSWFTVIGDNLNDYDRRCWCQFEALCALQFGSTPRASSLEGRGVQINAHTANLRTRAVAFASYLQCVSALPKEALPTEGLDIGSGLTRHGYYLDVPDLNDASFATFRNDFHAFGATDPNDPPRLWELLRGLFPRRRLDFTGIRY